MKTIVITGSTGGIGAALCRRMAQSGYSLALCATDDGRLQKQAETLIATFGISVHTRALNIADESSVKEFFDTAAEKFGKLDALIYLAGLSIPTKMETVSPNDFDRMYDVNVKGALLSAKHYAFHAVEQNGLIINLGSMAARRANANAPLYCTSKSALNMLASAMQLQLAGKNIRVTTLNPGGTDTPFWSGRNVDRRKLMRADEVVDVIEFVMNHPSMIFYCVDFEASIRISDLK